MATHLYRHRITAVIERDIPYDPAKPETFQAALQTVADQRKALAEMAGCTIKTDAGKPVAVRE